MQRTAEALPSDEDLVRRARDGDRAAFDLIVTRYRKEIYRIARRITGDHGEADDLAQETFCRAWQALPGFRGEASCRTWLCRIVTNLSINLIQSARVARREEKPPEALAERGHGATRPVGVDRMIENERNARLREAIEGLPPKQRLTLVLRAFEGMRYAEIARVLECSPRTAKANFFHAITALSRSFGASR